MAADVITPKKGLEGVIFDTSAISKVIPEEKRLMYRGYAVDALADHCSFDEVAYLLLHTNLPTASELESFAEDERNNRSLPESVYLALERTPKTAHPMDALRTAVSILGGEDEDAWNHDSTALRKKAVSLLARIPAVVAASSRLRAGLEPIDPDPSLSFSENFFHMSFGSIPEPEVVRAFDVSMTLYAEHGFNASTFTARVVVSSLSDIYSGVTAAIGSLKGPLHGGANEAVMHMLNEIGSPDKAEEWLLTALREKRKIMGMGHRVYRFGDSRVPKMMEYTKKLCALRDNQALSSMLDTLESTMVREKNIYPNLDFPAGPAYHLMGFEIEQFTPMFVMSRITGWCAHIIEQLENNRLVRPLSSYTGPAERSVTPLAERS